MQKLAILALKLVIWMNEKKFQFAVLKIITHELSNFIAMDEMKLMV